MRKANGTNSKRIPQWCVEGVKEVATSSAEERKLGEEGAQRCQHWEGLIEKQGKIKKEAESWELDN